MHQPTCCYLITCACECECECECAHGTVDVLLLTVLGPHDTRMAHNCVQPCECAGAHVHAWVLVFAVQIKLSSALTAGMRCPSAPTCQYQYQCQSRTSAAPAVLRLPHLCVCLMRFCVGVRVNFCVRVSACSRVRTRMSLYMCLCGCMRACIFFIPPSTALHRTSAHGHGLERHGLEMCTDMCIDM